MKNQEIRDRIADYVLGDFSFDEIDNIEENCGSLWIDLKDGESYYVQVSKCEKEESL